MILESRSIIFSDEELFLALRPTLEGRGLGPDIPVRSVSVALNDDGEVSASIDMADGSDSAVIGSAELGPAVLNHCID